MDAHDANSQHRPQRRQGFTRTLSKGSVITELQYSAGKSAATRFQEKDLAAQLFAPKRACHQLLRRTSTATLGRLDRSLAQASPVFASAKLRSALCITMQPLTALQVLGTKSCSGGHRGAQASTCKPRRSHRGPSALRFRAMLAGSP